MCFLSSHSLFVSVLSGVRLTISLPKQCIEKNEQYRMKFNKLSSNLVNNVSCKCSLPLHTKPGKYFYGYVKENSNFILKPRYICIPSFHSVLFNLLFFNPTTVFCAVFKVTGSVI